LTRHGCRTTDHFAGFNLTGHYDAAELARLIRQLPEGVTEFMCHPGFCTQELQGCPHAPEGKPASRAGRAHQPSGPQRHRRIERNARSIPGNPLTWSTHARSSHYPIIDRELLFGDPEISGAQLSPDGQYSHS
jgi:hypothetical protein